MAMKWEWQAGHNTLAWDTELAQLGGHPLQSALWGNAYIERALDELKLAEQLDPRDPLPHMIALIISRDIYRSFDAVQEATKALELLPYLKSVVPIENTRNALADFGTALLNFNLSEWAWSYSQESYDPHSANSHFFAARQLQTILSFRSVKLL